MNVDSPAQFIQALQRCDSCGSRCTATLPATELASAVTKVVTEWTPPGWAEATLPTECPPGTLLMILTYSYACGLFGSQEIAEELEDRADRCALVQQLPIEASTLAAFRRENHALLRRCLAALLRRSGTVHRAGMGWEGGPPLEATEPTPRASQPPDPEQEAERRIVLAAQTDSEERDL